MTGRTRQARRGRTDAAGPARQDGRGRPGAAGRTRQARRGRTDTAGPARQDGHGRPGAADWA
ncbi:hypothetical protein ACWGE0_20695 [Lentzea sp. NPDC054927]